MDEELIKELDWRFGNIRHTDHIELNAFEDADFTMYPAIEIPEVVNLRSDQCEALANYFIQLMIRGNVDDDSMAMASRGLASLAYNSFMDVSGDQKKPFFHKHNDSVYPESWLRTTGKSEIDLEEVSKLKECDSRYRLQLVDPAAGEFERKAAIGVWAFFHLGVFRYLLWDYLEKQIVDP